jgi:hypothetical protein
MPVQIGAKSHDFSNPTGLLSDCHRRIEMFLGLLQRVAPVIDSSLTADARTALETSLRYFQEAAPKHIEDEEESVFPRLRRMSNPEIERALATLERARRPPSASQRSAHRGSRSGAAMSGKRSPFAQGG